MAGIVGGIIGGAVKAHFFDQKVDKTREAVQKILGQMHQIGEALMSQGFAGMSMQRVELFNALDLQLQNFKVSYKDMMETTVDKIGDKAMSTLYQIDSIVHDWTKEMTGPKVERHLAELKGIALNSPFMKDVPRITAFFPVFVAPIKDGFNVLIECVGTFPSVDGSNERLKPTLLLGKKVYAVIHNSNSRLHFSVPMNEFFPQKEVGSTAMRTATYVVRFPHLMRGWICKEVVKYDFSGSLTLLPDSPGKVVVKYTKSVDREESGNIFSPTYIQNSRKDGLNKTCENNPYTLSTQPGWEIQKGSAQFHVHEKKGDRKTAKWHLVDDHPSKITFHVSTYHYDPAKHCDKLIFHISANIKRVISEIQTSPAEDMLLKWGESVVLDPLKGRCQVQYHCFNGNIIDLSLNAFDSYITYSLRDGRGVISAKAPEYISSFNVHLLIPTSKY